MTSPSSEIEIEKKLAAQAAVELVEDGMVVGLGSGSTAAYAITLLGERVRNGLQIHGIPTSKASHQQAIQAGIPLTTLIQTLVDIAIDGADRFDDQLNLIKGGGGALLREKIVAAASKRLVIIADSQKRSNPLGGFPVPVEVIPFGWEPVRVRLETAQLRPQLRMRDALPFMTDEGNYILDLHLDQISSPTALAAQLRFPGIVENGLFLGMASEVFMGQGTSVVRFTNG